MIVVPITLGHDVYWLSIQVTLIFSLSLLCLVTVWFAFFNRGEIKITEYAFEITDSELRYIRYDVKKCIRLDDYDGYDIRYRFPRTITIKSKQFEDIEFSYYTFSSVQRRELFSHLSAIGNRFAT